MTPNKRLQPTIASVTTLARARLAPATLAAEANVRHTEGMANMASFAFVLQHIALEDQDGEDVKFIGVYSSRELGESAIKRLSVQPGFSDYPSGFYLDEYPFDKDHWSEGFVGEN